MLPEYSASEWIKRQARLRIWYGGRRRQELYGKIRSSASVMLRNVHGVHGLQLCGGHPDRRDESLIDACDISHPVLVAGDATDDLRAMPPQLPFVSGSMSLLILWHVLELVESPRAMLAESERLLSADGFLLMVMFRPRGVVPATARRRFLEDTGCRRLVSPGRIHGWARETGLDVMSETGCWSWSPKAQRDDGMPPDRWYARADRLLWRQAPVRLLLLQKRTVPLTPIFENATRRFRRTVTDAGRTQASCRSRHVEIRDSAY